MAGMQVEPINVAKDGSIDMAHLRAKVSIICKLSSFDLRRLEVWVWSYSK